MRGKIVRVMVMLSLLLPASVSAEDMSASGMMADLLSDLEVRGEVKRLWGGNDVKFVLWLEDGSERGLKTVFRPEHLANGIGPRVNLIASVRPDMDHWALQFL